MSVVTTSGTRSELKFRHERIDQDPPSGRLTGCLATDLTGNGRDDVIVSSMGAKKRLRVRGKPTRLPNAAGLVHRLGRGEVHLCWYENPGWERHDISQTELALGVGHALGDVNGNGREDVIVGQSIHRNNVFWFEQPPNPRREWAKHVVTDQFEKYHDLAMADVDDDGDAELVGLSQRSEALFYYDIPEDPSGGPWPDDNCTLLAKGFQAEGLDVADVDGDGRTEILAGPNVFHQPATPGDGWRRQRVASGWERTRVAIADLTPGNGLQLVLSEGDLPHMGTHPGRVAILDPPDWSANLLREDLFCPHSLVVADFDGDGREDIYVAEMGLGKNDDPTHLVYRNEGDGTFTEHVVETGIPTHEATVADLTGNGRPDIVGKSYEPDHHVDVWYNET